MSIGAQSPIWRRALIRTLSPIYLRRKIKTCNGIFEAYVSPNSGLKVLSLLGVKVDPVHERFIRDWIEVDAIVWDIGANLGLFAFPAALKTRKGRVYAFEPDVELAANLHRSSRLRQNKQLNVFLLSVALSNVDGITDFQISRFSRALNRLAGAGTWNDARVATAELRPVVTMRIDKLARTIPPPTALKIDVEGAEMQVLEGGEETIAKYRPTILVEGPKELWDQMRLFFQRHQYVILDGAADTRSPLDEPTWDTVAVPTERVK
jgi:FkbM family methyltransferase